MRKKKMKLYNICRICLAEASNKRRLRMQPLFEDSAYCSEIIQRLKECGGIVLKYQETFPKMICLKCIKDLNNSYKFRLTCQASEAALLDAIVKPELKAEPETHTQLNLNGEHNIFFDIRTEFIDAEVIELADISDHKNEINNLSNDVDDLPSDDEFSVSCPSEKDVLPEEDDVELKTKKHCIKKPRKVVAIQKTGKRGRPPIHSITVSQISAESKNENIEVIKLETPSNIMCEICGNIYSKQSLLNMHMRRHLSEKPFECEICGKTFACPSEIGRHMRVHTGEKPYSCKYCNRTFADRSTNIKHERIHTNTRPFSCSTCGKSFTYSNVLKNHMLTHTGEKPFSCPPCNKTFSRKHQLDQHCGTMTHHQTIKNLESILPHLDESIRSLTQSMDDDKSTLNILGTSTSQ